MKILTWNCNGAFRKKFNSLKEFSADIIVIQECENPETTNDRDYKEWARNYLWTGDNKNKGLGIFANDKLTLTKLDWDSNGLKYFLPCKVNNDFNFIGAWCHGANSPTFGYIGQLWKYLQLHKSKFDNCVIAGDFNSNVIWDRWDRWWNHSDVIRELRELKIESFYHLDKKEEQGKETTSTLYLQRNLNKRYHIDYIFGSETFYNQLKRVTIGQPEKWLEISDHMPIICELN
jgi:exonuclease III